MTDPTQDPEVDGFLALLAARRAPKTVDAYRRDLRALADWLGGPPSKATNEDLERWLAELRAVGLCARDDRAPRGSRPLVLPTPRPARRPRR